MVSVINYKLGNLGSVSNMLQYLGIPAQIIDQPGQLENAEKIILPGVGAFDAGMESLKSNGWIEALEEKVLQEKVPVLGICLGMQLLTEASEEGVSKGLGYIKGYTRKLKPEESRLKVPHMGWADVVEHDVHVFPDRLLPESRFYFAHSFVVQLEEMNQLWLSARYGVDFCAAFHKDNILGVQFHPEKSHKYGLDFLKKFYFEFPNKGV